MLIKMITKCDECGLTPDKTGRIHRVNIDKSMTFYLCSKCRRKHRLRAIQ